MKKLIITLSLLNIFCAPANATSMCVEDDTVVVVLDPTIGYTGGLKNPLTFSYGKIFYTTAKVSKNYGNVVNELVDNGVVIVGGENYGSNEYIRLIHPLVSRWHRAAYGIESFMGQPSGRSTIFGGITE